MPEIFELMKKTLIFHASALSERSENGSPWSIVIGEQAHSPRKLPAGTGDLVGSQVWSWHYDPETPARVRDIFCYSPSHGHMKVCEEVAWTDMRIWIRGKEFRLPLDKDHLYCTEYLAGGDLARPSAATWPWPRKLQLDGSLLVTFSYDLDIDRGGVIKTPFDATRSANFMTAVGRMNLPTVVGDQITLVVGRTQVLVCLCFAFCRAGKNFEPMDVLIAGKMLPHAMVTTNIDLVSDSEYLLGKLSIVRPASTTMRHGGMEASHAMDADVPGDMLAKIEPLLVTDTNPLANRWMIDRILDWTPIPTPTKIDDLFPDMPFWDTIFDYFDADPMSRESQKFVVVEPKNRRRKIKKAVKFDSRLDGEFVKLARQGEFDNLHLAPRMKAPKYASRFLMPRGKGVGSALEEALSGTPAAASPPGKSADELDREAIGFDRIAMGPFCIHDCLHTHWRWTDGGKSGNDPWVRGWSATEPFAVDGAPMVPHNQRVTVELTSAHAFTTEIVAFGPTKACAWQVLNHQGSGYALALDMDFIDTTLFAGLKYIINPLINEAFTSEWWAIYWMLRHDPTWDDDGHIKNAKERIEVIDWAAARK